MGWLTVIAEMWRSFWEAKAKTPPQPVPALPSPESRNADFNSLQVLWKELSNDLKAQLLEANNDRKQMRLEMDAMQRACQEREEELEKEMRDMRHAHRDEIQELQNIVTLQDYKIHRLERHLHKIDPNYKDSDGSKSDGGVA